MVKENDKNSCEKKDVCPACKAAHEHSITLYELIDKKVDKKDTRLHKALEEHTGSLQSSLDDGKLRFSKIEDKAEDLGKKLDIKSDALNKKIDSESKETKKWLEAQLDKRDTSLETRNTQKKADKRQLIGILVTISFASLSALLTAIIVFTFLRSSVQHNKEYIDEIKVSNKEHVESNEKDKNFLNTQINMVEQKCAIAHSKR